VQTTCTFFPEEVRVSPKDYCCSRACTPASLRLDYQANHKHLHFYLCALQDSCPMSCTLLPIYSRSRVWHKAPAGNSQRRRQEWTQVWFRLARLHGSDLRTPPPTGSAAGSSFTESSCRLGCLQDLIPSTSGFTSAEFSTDQSKQWDSGMGYI